MNEYGRIVEEEWRRTAEMHPGVTLDAFVIMPNHLPSIIWIRDDAGDTGGDAGGDAVRAAPSPNESQRPRGPQSGSLGAIMAGFKSACTRRINDMRGTAGTPVWQRNYYERIIRYDCEWNAIGGYIQNNPANWAQDAENPDAPARPARRSS